MPVIRVNMVLRPLSVVVREPVEVDAAGSPVGRTAVEGRVRMVVTERDRQGVGDVGRFGEGRQVQLPLDGELDLFLGRPAVAGDRSQATSPVAASSAARPSRIVCR